MLTMERYGWGLGARALLRGYLGPRTAKLLVKPVAYWRSVEYAAALQQMAPRPGERVLDVSSPKLLALYLAERVGSEVVATDIDGSFIPEWAPVQRRLRIPASRLSLRVEDARALSFNDASFDAAYSISVLEHIPEHGDAEAMRELARVLRPGGRLLLTVPFSPTARDDFVDPARFYWSAVASRAEDGRAFFQRRYDEPGLAERLIAPSGLRLRSLTYYGERVLAGRTDRELVDYMPDVTGPVQPLLARLMVEGPVRDWRALRKPLCAAILLTKSEVPA